ncbi:aspartyl-phosphate phosphatase Spo0E family protein [Bacillus sp. FJAT-45350]|uniref:aspartyl-phosphate phosphatase Spo0E family protein n=1 Tax=Bacillus sp. FJAT-45350 TaxID=2011014 RepID=UPI00211BBF06|nr:aspartyl-phosphate phosphatase Spo0E family protein [Bacillus sp. FJAT-45350]
MLNRSYRKKECMEQIELLREKMISTAMLYGMNHPLVLKYSQEIDQKHNSILGGEYSSISHLQKGS